MRVDRDVLERIRRAASEEAAELGLAGMGLSEVPDAVFELWHLRALDLRGNKLPSVPSRIQELTNLELLDLRGNPLESLPDQRGLIVDWSTYERCRASVAPGHVEGIRFDAESGYLPGQLLGLPRLELLDFSAQGRSSLPEGVARLSTLRRLDLSSNRFTSIPPEVFELASLCGLDVSGNPIGEISSDMLRLDELEWLEVTLEGLHSPPSEIVAHGVDAIRDYFRAMDGGGVTRLAEVKLLIMGEGGVGKTTLVRKLTQPDRELRYGESTTFGLAIESWLIPLDDDRQAPDPGQSDALDNVRVNIWDFGGQMIYHGTHQLFLTRRSVYVLVVDSRTGETAFDYWLNIQEILGGDSPVLIVLNEKMDRRWDFDTGRLLGRFPNVQGIYRTNLATDRGLEDVRQAILSSIKRLAHVSMVFPVAWRGVRDALLEIREAHVPFERYEAICADHGILLTEEALILSRFLHDTGVLLHFQDDTVLRGTVFTDPGWMSHAMYMLLDDRQMHGAGGRFDDHTVKRVWADGEYAPMIDVLIRLLVRFELVYPLVDGRGYLCPQFLPITQPQYDWSATGELSFRYLYDFLPVSVFPRLLVCLLDLRAPDTSPWRRGMLLERGATRALIRQIEDHEIVVRVAGADNRELLSIIDQELQRINATLPHIRYRKLFRCNCSVCETAADPHFFSYEVLRRLRADRRDSIQCHVSFEMVNVRRLLEEFPESVVPRARGPGQVDS